MNFISIECKALQRKLLANYFHLFSFFLSHTRYDTINLKILNTCFADFFLFIYFYLVYFMRRGKHFTTTDASTSSSDPPSSLFFGELYCKILIVAVVQY